MSYKKSICKISLTENNKTILCFTGVVISKSGYILSAGHPFNSVDINKMTLNVHFHIKNSSYKADLVEWVYSKETKADFSILKIRNYEQGSQGVIDVCLNQNIGYKQELDLFGYSNFNTVDPMIHKIVIIGGIDENNLFLVTAVVNNPGLDLRGFSGAPLIYISNQGPKIVAIQSLEISTNQGMIPYAVTINSILQNSEFIHSILLENKYPDGFISYLMDNDIVLSPKALNQVRYNDLRWNLFLTTTKLDSNNDIETIGGKFYTDIMRYWTASFVDKINLFIKSAFSEGDIGNISNVKNEEVRFDSLQSNNKIKEAVDQATYPNGNMRIFIDFESLSLKIDGVWQDYSAQHLSHRIAVNLIDSIENISLSSNSNFDLIYNIGIKNYTSDQLFEIVNNILIDIYIDRFVFYKYKIFRSIFRNDNLKKYYSRLKVNYAIHSKLKVYGVTVNHGLGLGYIPLLSMLKSSVQADNVTPASFYNLVMQFVKYSIETPFEEEYLFKLPYIQIVKETEGIYGNISTLEEFKLNTSENISKTRVIIIKAKSEIDAPNREILEREFQNLGIKFGTALLCNYEDIRKIQHLFAFLKFIIFK